MANIITGTPKRIHQVQRCNLCGIGYAAYQGHEYCPDPRNGSGKNKVWMVMECNHCGGLEYIEDPKVDLEAPGTAINYSETAAEQFGGIIDTNTARVKEEEPEPGKVYDVDAAVRNALANDTSGGDVG